MGLLLRVSLFALAVTLPLYASTPRAAFANQQFTAPVVNHEPRIAQPSTSVRIAQAGAQHAPEPAGAKDDEDPFALRRTRVPLLKPSADTETEERNEADEEISLFEQWWFWAAAAVIVGGTVALGVIASQPNEIKARPCGMGFIVCFGDGL